MSVRRPVDAGYPGHPDARPTFLGVPNRGARVKGGPNQYLRAGSTWPTGRLLKSAPVAAYWSAEISRRLAAAMEGRSKSSVAEEAGIRRATIYSVLDGSTWPDIVTIATLEGVLGVPLWPRWDVGQTHE